jgi:hypothetical protein
LDFTTPGTAANGFSVYTNTGGNQMTQVHGTDNGTYLSFATCQVVSSTNLILQVGTVDLANKATNYM